MDPDAEILIEFTPLMIQYKSGRVVRFFGTDIVPASTDSETGVISKDVIIDLDINLAVRLYLPNLSNQANQKLPIYVYYHGGGFLVGSAFEPSEHKYLNQLVAEAKVMAISVNYRLAPEHPLPIAYEDSWLALKWVLSHSNGGPEPWLTKHGDFQRIFVAGFSAGGNVAHNVALRVGNETIRTGVVFEGLVLIQPFFASPEAIKSERVKQFYRATTEKLWKFVKPGTIGLNDADVNPFVEEAPDIKGLRCKRMMVSVSEDDWLAFWYYQGIKESGWKGEVELHESMGEGHAFHLEKPECEKAVDLKMKTIAFLNK